MYHTNYNNIPQQQPHDEYRAIFRRQQDEQPLAQQHQHLQQQQQQHQQQLYYGYYPENKSYYDCIENIRTNGYYEDNSSNNINYPSNAPVDDRANYLPTVNPPSWCVPARGESRLEPLGVTEETHPSIDLTTRPYFRIGRSPASDIPLLHTTSSRNHAVIYHHPSGACYIIDCKSVHGTYVDGVRIYDKAKKVRRGALLQFGAPGASPTFVLKSFGVSIGDLISNLGGVTDTFTPDKKVQQPPVVAKEECHIICESFSAEEEEVKSKLNENDPDDSKIASNNVQNYFRHAQHWVQHQSRRRRTTNSNNYTKPTEDKVTDVKTTPQATKESDNFLTCIRGDGGGVACMATERDAPQAALVLLNTRLNAIGQEGGLHSYEKTLDVNKAQEKFQSLFRLYSSDEEDRVMSNDVGVVTPVLVGKKRKREWNSSTITTPPQNHNTHKKYKPILMHSVSIDEECSNNIIPNNNEYHPYNQPNQYYHHPMEAAFHYTPMNMNTMSPRRRTIRFADENNEDDRSAQFYKYPAVSFECCDDHLALPSLSGFTNEKVQKCICGDSCCAR